MHPHFAAGSSLQFRAMIGIVDEDHLGGHSKVTVLLTQVTKPSHDSAAEATLFLFGGRLLGYATGDLGQGRSSVLQVEGEGCLLPTTALLPHSTGVVNQLDDVRMIETAALLAQLSDCPCVLSVLALHCVFVDQFVGDGVAVGTLVEGSPVARQH